ncbi:UNVERIFIED_ORG: hypothetical protein FHU00_1138 [Citrobacter freundii]|jgi:hypothetical protein
MRWFCYPAYPSHVLMYVPGDSLRCRLDATRNPLGIRLISIFLTLTSLIKAGFYIPPDPGQLSSLMGRFFIIHIQVAVLQRMEKKRV